LSCPDADPGLLDEQSDSYGKIARAHHDGVLQAER
jgi:hypothetical protein